MDYLVVTEKQWNIDAFNLFKETLPGRWHLITDRHLLTLNNLQLISPEYIFFPHWSYKVSEEILSQYQAVCFHMTDLPFGRGGSPLQNLILSGVDSTMLSAIKMTNEIDAGPVYLKTPLKLEGSAEAIFKRAAPLVFELIAQIITLKIEPEPQQGLVTHFKRRMPEQSLLPYGLSQQALYDFIRMLDADTYPKSFIEYEDWRLEFSEAKCLDSGEVSAKVMFKPKREKQ